MLKYICQDMLAVLKYLPWAVVLGIPAAVLFLWIERRLQRMSQRMRREKEPVMKAPVVFFWIYMAVILLITLLSRESGSRIGMDLKLFSTWGINPRNNAYVVENVLLFIPFGFLSSFAFRRMRRFAVCTLFGALVSIGVETLQLLTGRGFFQLDDIMTNILGTMLGCAAFLVIKKIRS